MKTISLMIFGNLILNQKYLAKLNLVQIHINQWQDRDILQIFTMVKCTYLEEFLKLQKNFLNFYYTILKRKLLHALVVNPTMLEIQAKRWEQVMILQLP